MENNGNKLILNDEQLLASKHRNGAALVLAIPGSGKTTLLLQRTINLINSNIEPEKIFSVSFSKASAQEMNYRFNKFFGRNSSYFSTIHSFSYSVIKKYSYDNNIKYEFLSNPYSIINEIYFKKYKKNLSFELYNDIINLYSYSKNTMKKIKKCESVFNNSDINFNIILNLLKKYDLFKNKNNIIDFEDMLTKSLEILRIKKYNSYYQNLFKYIQVDECQDTSKIQYEILNILSKKHSNIFMVADDDQSIYGFRGAEPKYILNLKKDYKNLKTYYLKTNYRSDKSIITVLNRFINTNKIRYFKDYEGFSKNEGNVSIFINNNTSTSLKQIIYLVNELKGTTAILYKNNISAMLFVSYFLKNNIDFKIYDSLNLFMENSLTRDLLNTLYKLNKENKEFKNMSSIKAINYILKYQTDRIKIIKSNTFDYNHNQIIENIKNICKLYPNINDFIEFMLLLKEYENYPPTDAKLNILSIHKSKGMEFDNVILVDINENIIPRINNLDENKNKKLYEIKLEDEKRVLYVGMSRAKKNLYFFHNNYINSIYNKKSRFLDELIELNKDIIKIHYDNNLSDDEFIKLINKDVYHNKFKHGKIVDISGDRLIINFNSKIKVLNKNLLNTNFLKLTHL